jgi:hypothetical protein
MNNTELTNVSDDREVPAYFIVRGSFLRMHIWLTESIRMEIPPSAKALVQAGRRHMVKY